MTNEALISKATLLLLMVFLGQNVFACVNCNKEIKQAIFNSTFYPNLFVILSAFIALAIVVSIISWISTKNHISKVRASPYHELLSPVPVTATATVLGTGIGGFIDKYKKLPFYRVQDLFENHELHKEY